MPKKIFERTLTAHDYSEAIELAQQLDTVESIPTFQNLPSGNFEVIPHCVGLRNTTTNEVVSTVGRRYEPVQPEQLLLEALQGLNSRGVEIGTVKVHQSDVKQYIHISFKEEVDVSTGVRKNDLVSFGVLLENTFDGTAPVKGGLCGFRLVCSNGMVTRTKDIVSIRAKHVKGQVSDLFGSGLNSFLDSVADEISGWAARIREAQVSTIETHEADLLLSQSGLPGRIQERVWERLHDEVKEEDHVGQLDRWTLYNAATWVMTHTPSTNDPNVPMFNEGTRMRHAGAIEALLTAEVEAPELEEGEDLELRTWVEV